MAEVVSAAGSERPALVVDIDGVFNIWAKPAPEGCLQRPDDFGLGVYYNPNHGVWLQRIHKELAAVYYISDLQDESDGHMRKVHDLPRFDWINIDPYVSKAHSCSAARALAITALFGNRTVAWLDDIITDTEFRWAKLRSAEGVPTLLIKTRLDTGLQPEHMDQVEDWLRQTAHS